MGERTTVKVAALKFLIVILYFIFLNTLKVTIIEILNFQQPFIRFNRQSESYVSNVSKCSFSEIQREKNVDVRKLISEFCQKLQENGGSTNITLKNDDIDNFAESVNTIFAPKFENSTKIWPPKIKITGELMFETFCILVTIAHECQNAKVFFEFLHRKIFTKISNSSKKRKVRAFSTGSTNSQRCFVFLKSDNSFVVYSETNSVFSQSVVGKFTSISVTNDIVNFIGKDSNVLFSFVPSEKQLAKMWLDIQKEEQKSPFSFFEKNMKNVVIPEVIHDNIASIFVDNSSFAMRALLSAKVSNQKSMKNILISLFKVYSSNNSLPVFYSTLLIHCLYENKCKDVTKLLESGSCLTLMIDFLVEKYGSLYYESFIKKFVDYVDSKGDMKLCDQECDVQNAKIVFFSALKYICGSISSFPKEISYFLSFVRTYSSLIYNDRSQVFSLLSSIYINHVFVPMLKGNATFPAIKMQNEKSSNEMFDMILTTLRGERLKTENPGIIEWEKRVTYHMRPLFDLLYSSISDFCDLPNYSFSKKETEDAFSLVVKHISLNKDAFVAENERLMNENDYGNTASWNMCIYISMMFPFASDGPELRSNAEDVGYIYKNMLNNEYLMKVTPQSTIIPTKPSPFIKEKEPSKMFTIHVEPTKKAQKLPEMPPLPIIGDDPYDDFNTLESESSNISFTLIKSKAKFIKEDDDQPLTIGDGETKEIDLSNKMRKTKKKRRMSYVPGDLKRAAASPRRKSTIKKKVKEIIDKTAKNKEVENPPKVVEEKTSKSSKTAHKKKKKESKLSDSAVVKPKKSVNKKPAKKQ